MKVLEQIRYVLGEFGLQGIIDWAILLTYLIGTIVLLTLLIYI
jgi:cytochrome c oxidase subunit IV